MKRRITWLAGAIAPVVAPAFAQVQAQQPAAPAPSSVLGLGQGLLGLIVVVALIYVAAWAMRRMGTKSTKNGIVQVLGGASVGPRERVVVVRFASRTLLLGVAPGHVALLQTMDASEGVDDLLVTDDAARAAKPRFADRLRAAKCGA